MKRREDFTTKSIIDAYESSVSIPEAAEKLGVNRKTLWTWLKKLDLPTDRQEYRKSTTADWGSFAQWLRQNKKVLPNNVRELSELSGCSVKSVESYLYRRKRRLEARAQHYVEDYIKRSTTWPDGSMMDSSPFFTIKGDLWTHTVQVVPEGATPFIIGVKAPSGYRRKT